MVERQRNPSPLRVPRCYAPAATNYRRNFLAGGRFFFTLNLTDRRQRLLTDNIALLRHAFKDVRHRHPFAIDAIVVLPDHLHTIWTLPEGDADFDLGKPCPKQERGIWQRRY